MRRSVCVCVCERMLHAFACTRPCQQQPLACCPLHTRHLTMYAYMRVCVVVCVLCVVRRRVANPSPTHSDNGRCNDQTTAPTTRTLVRPCTHRQIKCEHLCGRNMVQSCRDAETMRHYVVMKAMPINRKCPFFGFIFWVSFFFSLFFHFFQFSNFSCLDFCFTVGEREREMVYVCVCVCVKVECGHCSFVCRCVPSMWPLDFNTQIASTDTHTSCGTF